MDMIPVVVLVDSSTPYGTTLWASHKVIGLFLESRGRLGAKAQHFCDAGFKMLTPNALKLEHGKTYGLHMDQFRIAGFFDRGYGNFIALDGFVKKTQRNDRRMSAIYRKVDAVREAGTWQRME